jgi:site-specific DNA recombinase
LEERGGECTSATISEETLQQSVVRAINQVIGDKDGFLAVLQKNIATVLDEQDDMNADSIDVRLVDLQKELLQLASSGSQYMGVANEICKLREEKQSVLSQTADLQTKRQRIAKMTEFLNCQTGLISRYDEKMVRRLVERITVQEGKVVVGFRSGVEVRVEMIA